MDPKFKASPAAVAVIGLLHIGPLHPYGMQRLIKQLGKDRVVNVGQRANLYKTIKRLLDAGLISVAHTERDSQYPERTVYELTEEGRSIAPEWIAEMAANPRNEFPEFPAALSFLMMLGPDRAAEVLTIRSEILAKRLAEMDAELDSLDGVLPKVVLLDDEYGRVIMKAEVDWLNATVEQLRSGELSWNEDLLDDAQKLMQE